ncbi:MAG: tRNA-binding protein [Bacteroidota bacterium]
MADAPRAVAPFEAFAGLDLRVGRIERAEAFPEARRPAYKLWIDFGELGLKKTSAQLTDRYTVADLPGRLVVAVVNFAPKQIGPFMSEVLVLGAVEPGGAVTLLTPEADVLPGTSIA